MRHAETAWNVERRYQGQTDIPLSDVGRHQAQVLHERLIKHSELFDPRHTAIISSDLSRAHETARLVFGLQKIELDVRFRESRYGIFEGLSHDEIATRYPEHFAQWRSDQHDFVIPGSEPRSEVRARAAAAVDAWLAQVSQPNLVVVTHGGVMRQLISRVRSDEGSFDLAQQVSYHNAVVHEVIVEDGVWSYGGTL